MTAAEKLIEKNNYLREQLTAENKEYYEEILVYIRAKSLFHEEEDVEVLLMELLNDLLDAQSHGESAKSYFGENPQESIDNLLKQLPKISLKKRSGLFAIVFAISSFFSLFSSLTDSRPSINFLSLILNCLIALIFIHGAFYLISSFSFKPLHKKNKLKGYASSFIYGCLYIALTFLSNHLGSYWLSIPVSSYTGLLIAWLALIIIAIWIIIKREKDYYYAIPTMFIFIFLPTLQKLPWFASLFSSTFGKLIGSIIIFLFTALFLFLQFRKKE